MICSKRNHRPLVILVLVALLGARDAGPLSSALAAQSDPVGRADDHDHEAPSGASPDTDGHEGGENVDLVQVTPEQRERFDISVAIAGPGTIDTFTELPGQVRPNGDKLAHIVARFPGVVREVRKTIGDPVKAGDVLATVESSTSLSPYTLTTGIDGVIIDKHLTQGEAIDAAKGAFLVANLDDVWIDLAVYQKDLEKVTRGQTVRISAGKEIPAAEGPISYLTPTVDAPTRTATARVVLPNLDGRWRPGMFVTGRVIAPIRAALVVPLTAVQTVEGTPVVFVDTPKGFEPRPVILGTRGESQIAIESGLAPNERYAATNSFLLKAELGKGEAEHEH